MEQEPKSVEVEDTTNDDEPLFFYMPNAIHGEFSQWARSTFTMSKSEISSLVGHPVDDPSTTTNTENSSGSITFSCAEQLMMFCKASRFRDYESQRRILATADPKVQRQLGRLVTGFHDVYWDEVKSLIVFSASMAKFGQNPELKRKLLATGDRGLVEAAPRDRVWGIGYSAKHALAHRKHWGENRLGRALMEAREQLRMGRSKHDEYGDQHSNDRTYIPDVT